MHCADPGCLAACPADGAIVQYQNGIVDFQQDYCIGCQYCVTGCPFNIPKFNPQTKKMFKCTLCYGPRVAGPGARLHQGLPHRLPALRHQGGHDGAGRNARPTTARALRLTPTPASTIRRASAAPASSTCCTTSPIPRPTAACPPDPRVPLAVRLWKGPLKWLGNLAMIGGLIGVTMHYLRFGPKQ